MTLNKLRQKAKKKNGWAMFEMGRRYEFGEGVELSLEKAVEYYENCIKAAQECYDAHSEGIANHRLGTVILALLVVFTEFAAAAGKLWLDLNETDKSISHQKAYLEYCKSVSPEDQV